MTAPTTWDKPWPFDPENDYPPVGAPARASAALVATFTEGDPFPRWCTDTGRYVHAFSATGMRLARAWAIANGVPLRQDVES